MKLKTLCCISALLLSNLSAASSENQPGIKLYADASQKSKVIDTITLDNQGQYMRFYTDKDGKWAKYANSHTGDVGSVDLGQIEQNKADVLRKNILDGINDRI